MIFNTLLALLASTGFSTALTCGNEFADTIDGREVPPMRQYRLATPKRQDVPIPVDVYFHVASSEKNRDVVTEDIVAKQFEVLRDSFLPHKFDLTLVNTSYIVDDVLATGYYSETSSIENYTEYVAFRTANRRGGYDALNVFFHTDLPPSLGGQCNIATPATVGDSTFWTDGCTVNAFTMPGLNPPGKDETEPRRGHIAVHESGHWFGLLHTFNGRPCDAFNDYVSDTPAQSGYSSGCPIGRDSCPDQEGLDPIQNFMDYSDDSCTTEFTPGQQARMHQLFDVYRASVA